MKFDELFEQRSLVASKLKDCIRDIVKKSIYKELKGLAKQIGEYLELPKKMVYLQ